MIINQLCTSLSGGASVAAVRLHHSLRTAGIDSRFWFSDREKKAAPHASVQPIAWGASSNWLGRIARSMNWSRRKLSWAWLKFQHLRRRPVGYEIFTPARLPVETTYDSSILPGDVLHLHWVAKLIDYPTFFASVPNDLPIVWTLHDMNPFTGGCHFSANCHAYVEGCGRCPQLANPGDFDLSQRQFLLKRDALQGKNLHVVAPSHWLLDAARRSAIFREARSFHWIPYGLQTEHFFPQDKIASREQFQVPRAAVVVGFGADLVTNRRKGWREMLAALSQLRGDRPIVALVFGGGELPKSTNRNLTIIPVGYVNDKNRLAQLYSAMDFFVLPSLEDNLPQTGLEAIACGTPVVAFNAGGIPDFVLHEQTGLLAKIGDPADLARQMQRLINHPEQLVSMGTRARQLIVEKFSSNLEANAYIQLYQELIAQRAHNLPKRAA